MPIGDKVCPGRLCIRVTYGPMHAGTLCCVQNARRHEAAWFHWENVGWQTLDLSRPICHRQSRKRGDDPNPKIFGASSRCMITASRMSTFSFRVFPNPYLHDSNAISVGPHSGVNVFNSSWAGA